MLGRAGGCAPFDVENSFASRRYINYDRLSGHFLCGIFHARELFSICERIVYDAIRA